MDFLEVKVKDLIKIFEMVEKLVTSQNLSEQLIVGLIAELDKAQARITSLEDLAADYVQDMDQDVQAAAEAAIREFIGSVHVITDGVAHEVAGAFGLKL